MSEKEGKPPMYAKIMQCSCNNEGQDTLHGKGKRVYNMLYPVKDKPDRYRCTVCGRTV